MEPSIHASAVLVGAKAVLIRGAPGSGKTSLALQLVALAVAVASRMPSTRSWMMLERVSDSAE